MQLTLAIFLDYFLITWGYPETASLPDFDRQRCIGEEFLLHTELYLRLCFSLLVLRLGLYEEALGGSIFTSFKRRNYEVIITRESGDALAISRPASFRRALFDAS
jgi:hypothetical protein